MFGMTILPDTFYTPITIFILAPGAFFVLSCMIAIRNKLNNRKPVEERRDLPQGCGDCANCALTGCASRSFFDMSVDSGKADSPAQEPVKESAAKEAGAKEADVKEAGAKEAGVKEAGAKDSAAQNPEGNIEIEGGRS